MIYIEDILTAAVNRIKTGGNISQIVDNYDNTFVVYTDNLGSVDADLRVIIGTYQYTIVSVNNLLKTFTITVSSADPEPTGSAWELAVFFMFGHRIELDNILNNKTKAKKDYLNYPFIWLLTDYEKTAAKDELFDVVEYEANINIALVEKTQQGYIASQRLEQKFKKVLDKIFYLLETELNNRPISDFFYKKSYGKNVKFNQVHRYFYGSSDKSKNVFTNNFTDAIELETSLAVKFNTSNCIIY